MLLKPPSTFTCDLSVVENNIDLSSFGTHRIVFAYLSSLLGQSELGFLYQNWVFQNGTDKLILNEVYDGYIQELHFLYWYNTLNSVGDNAMNKEMKLSLRDSRHHTKGGIVLS